MTEQTDATDASVRDAPSLQVVPLCGGDHNRDVRAVAEVTFPEGHYDRAWACVGHTEWLIGLARAEAATVNVRWLHD